jgi:predicted dehydrogenase
VIGCGWRGGQLLDEFSKIDGVNIAGICDADQARIDEWSAKYPSARTWNDMRGLLDSADIDAVAIATCNHWHCLAAIRALEAGKHVYVEKPLAHYHWEGEQVVNAVKKYNRICQVGTQQRTDPMQAEIKEFLHEENALGAIRWVRANRYGIREPIGKRSEPLQIPDSVNVNLWTGPAAEQPLYRNALHYDWHWDHNTGSGEMGNWGVHIIDDVRNNAFLDKVAIPRRAVAAGGRFWPDAGNTPNFHFAILDTGEVPTVVCLTNLPKEPGSDQSPGRAGPGSGYVVYCDGGRLEGERGRAAAFDADGNRIKQFRGNSGGGHQQNFIRAVRNDDPSRLNTPIEMGHQSTAWCNWANIAYRVSTTASPGTGSSTERIAAAFGANHPAIAVFEEMQRTLAACAPDAPSDALDLGPVLEFDEQAGQFVGDNAQQANGLLRRDDRSGFEVPDLSVS